MTTSPSSSSPLPAELHVGEQGTLLCRGAWTLPSLPALERRLAKFAWPASSELVWDAGGIEALDTAGAWLLQRTIKTLQQHGKSVVLKNVRPEFGQLLDMVGRDENAGTLPAPPRVPGLFEACGRTVWQGWRLSVSFLSFFGESVVAFLKLLGQPQRFRWHALFVNLEATGLNALPIIGLLSFLMGVVISYQAAVQLRPFGANIFIVDLVGISILREIGPLVTAIIVAGRSGSAYAAQIGTMKVTQEVDALRTLGIAPMELLVIPRVVALVIALPLLTVFADALGVSGGMLIASSQLDVSARDFLNRFEEAVAPVHYLIGLGKAPVFAMLIAVVGCFQGFQVQGSADSVGRHTTMSVVQGIFLVIVADAFFSVLFSWLGV